MKTYIYTYERKKNDVNGNPRHSVTVYRVKHNAPELLQAFVDVGYRGNLQVVYDVISRIENWGKKEHTYGSGYSKSGVGRAHGENKIRIITV